MEDACQINNRFYTRRDFLMVVCFLLSARGSTCGEEGEEMMMMMKDDDDC